MALTDTAIRTAKPKDKPYRLSDAGGLYMEVSPAGGKLWRLKYRFDGKEKRLAMGAYPDTSLKDARDKRDVARKLLANGVDPSEQKKAAKAAGMENATNSFEVIAREWFAKQSKTWAESHSTKIMIRLEKDIFPWLGSRPIADISAPDFLSCLRRVESRGAVESSHRILQNCGQIMRYAIATGRATQNPVDALKGALTPVQATHRASITEPKAVGELLRAIDGYQGATITKCALRLAPLTFVRPGELRNAEWAEIDLSNAEWNIPKERMKTREAHIVPLSTQALEILSELEALTGRGRYVFPGARTPKRPMSNNAILAALRRMGYAKDEMSGHGFRAMARTILDEVLHIRPDYIEHQLAHAVRDPNGRAYNRTSHLAERKVMMQQWADYLDALKQGGNILPMKRKA